MMSSGAQADTLKAGHITRANQTIIAHQRVEVTTDKRVLMCDRLDYNPATQKVEAFGNVTLMSPSGKVTFYEALEIRGSLKQSIIAQLHARSTEAVRAASSAPDKPALGESGEPVVLEAGKVNYDHERDVVMASDRVEVMQGESILLSDRLIYDQRNNKVYAKGNVSLLEPDGNVVFADQIELTDDMKSGVIHQFRARMSDNSLFAAAQGRKIDEDRFSLFKAVYSPCKVSCSPEVNDSPLWQIKAEQVDVDQKKQTVTYDNAFFEVFGVPVLYTPYFSHPTPDAPNQSGLLMPTYKSSQNLGQAVKIPVYIALAEDYDVTLSPMFTSKAGEVLFTEYRQQFDSGSLFVDGSITNAPDFDNQGNELPGNKFRGHMNARGKFKIDPTYGWGFDISRASDDTYLRRYQINSYDTYLTSRLYAEGANFEGTNNRSYAVVEALAFQGLALRDDRDVIPTIFPQTYLSFQGDPGWANSRWSVDAGARMLLRDDGADSRMLSATLGWSVPYVTEGGQILELSTKLRNDIYWVDDLALSGGAQAQDTNGRIVPEASLLWRYPLINHFDSGESVMIEPVVNMTISPDGGNPLDIPNEDSRFPEFTESNLFSNNHYAGYDRIESGPRVSYGMRAQAQVLGDAYVDALIGQQYRVNDDPNFPISSDPDSRFSDYVGRVGLNYELAQLDYRFRLDKDSLSPERNEVTGSISVDPVYLGVSYLSQDDDLVFADREQISGSATVRMTDEWYWQMGGSRDLERDANIGTYGGLIFQNECTILSLTAHRTYTRDRDVRPETSVTFTFSLKNLE